ncbi:MAG: phosphatidate cytidylyltransferase [Pseudorhodobacter sp.]
MSRGAPNWGDLTPRILSAVILVALGGVALWLGNWAFVFLCVTCVGLMTWELARMTRGEGRDYAIPLAFLAALTLLSSLVVNTGLGVSILILAPVLGLVTTRRDPLVWFAYAMVILAVGWSLIVMRIFLGIWPLLWLLAVVVASDVMGYFAGRLIGGPKFWPRISPKKTWSGTIAGWVGAALVGVLFVATGRGGMAMILISPFVALAGQMGDIAESAIKRRAGVKDSSNLIPGHGGMMDRFDALAFATLFVMAARLFLPIFESAGAGG